MEKVKYWNREIAWEFFDRLWNWLVQYLEKKETFIWIFCHLTVNLLLLPFIKISSFTHHSHWITRIASCLRFQVMIRSFSDFMTKSIIFSAFEDFLNSIKSHHTQNIKKRLKSFKQRIKIDNKFNPKRGREGNLSIMAWW